MKILLNYKFKNINEYVNECRTNYYVANKTKQKETMLSALAFSKIPPIKDYPIELIFYWHIKNKQCDLVACICGSYSIEKELMKAEVFGDYIDLVFEGIECMSIVGYDSYLRSLYGDYMKLPPVEKRVTRHTFDAYFKEEFNDDKN